MQSAVLLFHMRSACSSYLILLDLIILKYLVLNNCEIYNLAIKYNYLKPQFLYNKHHIICKFCFLDFAHHLYFSKITTFRKLDLLPSSGNRTWTSRSETSSTRGPNSQPFCPSFLPEHGRRSSFRNVVILLKYRRWTKSKNRT
jgi:hypothetical protein